MKLFIAFLSLFPFELLAQNNIGIGTVNPEAKLHIVSNTSEVMRVEAFLPFISFYTNGSQRAIIGATPNGLEIGTAAGFGAPIVLSPEGNPVVRVYTDGKVRIEGSVNTGGVGFSMGGYGEFQVDKPGIVSGRFIIKEDGKVGIGNTNPTEILDVAGTIRATAFKFENPKTYYYNIHPSAFVSRPYPNEIYYSTGAYLQTTGNFTDMCAPLNLPHNAMIKKIRVDLYDNSPALDIFITLTKIFPNGTNALSFILQSTGNPGNVTLESNTLFYLINNTSGGYAIVASTTDLWPGSSLVIRSISIEYILDAL